MSLPGLGTIVRGSGKDLEVWKVSCTYDASSVPTLDESMSDQDPRVPTPVAKAGTGITTLNFPKCDRAWLLNAHFQANAPGTAGENLEPDVSELDETAALAGTCTIRLNDPDGDTGVVDTASGDRLTVLLLIEHS